MTHLLALSLCLLAKPDAAFDGRLERYFTASGVPGAAIRAIVDGKVVYEKAFGVIDLDSKGPTALDSAFEIGSVSKQFVATALLMLVAEGKVDLQAKVGDVIADLPASWRGATVDQILHHMSGIPDYEEIAGYDFYNQPRATKDIVAEASKKEPAFKPGEKFEYSNTGYFLISMIVEQKSGMPVGRFLTKRIFEPLGMTSTYADVQAEGAKPMTGYHSRSGTRTKEPPIAWTSTLGAGGIVSTLDDLMKWDAALYTDKLVKQDLLQKIWTPTKLNDGSVNSYGYGWFSTTFRGTRELNHSGQTNGFTCYYRRFPEKKASVWAFCNTYGGNVFEMVNAVAGRYVPGASYMKLVVPAEPDAARSALHLKALRQAVLAEGDMALLAPNIKNFATADGFKDLRAELKGHLDKHKSWAFLTARKRTNAAGLVIDDHIYRQELTDGDVKFWTLGWANGLLSGIRIEDE